MTTLFDSRKIVKPASFAAGLTPARRTLEEVRQDNIRSLELLGLTAEDHARIEAARADARAEALGRMSDAEAEEFAGDAAVAAFDHCLAMRAARRDASRAKPARRMPFTEADLAFWAANAPSNARDFEVVGPSDAALELSAGAALATARMSAGHGAF